MRKVNRRKDDEILQILREYCSSDISANELKEKYSLSSSSQLIGWFRKFADPSIRKSEEMKGRDNDNHQARGIEESLLEENARLRRELEQARLRAEGLNLMIDLAEKEFKVSIRKKCGAKQ